MRNTATINGASLVYDDIGPGDGPALLLVHGYPLNRAMWRAQRDALVGLGWRGILPDLRGFGDSQATPPPYSMDLFADDLAALLDHLGLERVALGGLSMGGYIAFAFWRRHAARVRALVLADTQAALDTAEARAGRLASLEAGRAQPGAAQPLEGRQRPGHEEGREGAQRRQSGQADPGQHAPPAPGGSGRAVAVAWLHDVGAAGPQKSRSRRRKNAPMVAKKRSGCSR
jgi:pimeloyl-ACP methyl ester carboxylesterase